MNEWRGVSEKRNGWAFTFHGFQPPLSTHSWQSSLTISTAPSPFQARMRKCCPTQATISQLQSGTLHTPTKTPCRFWRGCPRLPMPATTLQPSNDLLRMRTGTRGRVRHARPRLYASSTRSRFRKDHCHTFSKTPLCSVQDGRQPFAIRALRCPCQGVGGPICRTRRSPLPPPRTTRRRPFSTV